jgi:hypothetical protein
VKKKKVAHRIYENHLTSRSTTFHRSMPENHRSDANKQQYGQYKREDYDDGGEYYDDGRDDDASSWNRMSVMGFINAVRLRSN